ncbi:phosphoribosylanthranilate isomerase [Sphingobacterium olei]|uniref:N-(5'-phosphoribosyl)anthranilate isomerase n=1 Tax=Sphingobacterium olei TaxID=2571155 RepID=A0A4U0P3M3_9SPHI|nr:phosphoribosylanthranilate isomerase [Sphingobacterium olei]TJZ61212.1 phosphoribosylanthranilate isomerase [Sphingobacterium olei]
MANRNLKIKVCGMRDPQNIIDVASLNIDYMGFIFYPQSKRFVDHITSEPSTTKLRRTGVFVNDHIAHIKTKTAEFSLQAIQLHGNEDVDFCRQVAQPDIQLIKAFGIDDDFDWKSTEPFLHDVDFFLFDTKSTDYGGTGQSFNWQKLTDYPYDKPYFLSGGLSLENIQEAGNFEDDRLFGLDLNSKFEIEPGLKNISTLTQALKLLRDE